MQGPDARIPQPGEDQFLGHARADHLVVDHVGRRAAQRQVALSLPDDLVAIMGASIGTLGTARAQYHLRQMFVFLNMYAVNQPEVMVSNAQKRFDENGKLTDETSKKLIMQLLEELVNWTRRLEKQTTD